MAGVARSSVIVEATPRPYQRRDLFKRFWSKVDKNGPLGVGESYLGKIRRGQKRKEVV